MGIQDTKDDRLTEDGRLEGRWEQLRHEQLLPVYEEHKDWIDHVGPYVRMDIRQCIESLCDTMKMLDDYDLMVDELEDNTKALVSHGVMSDSKEYTVKWSKEHVIGLMASMSSLVKQALGNNSRIIHNAAQIREKLQVLADDTDHTRRNIEKVCRAAIDFRSKHDRKKYIEEARVGSDASYKKAVNATKAKMKAKAKA